MRTVIVGAGITGLALGSLLREKHPNDEVTILEKSRGVGGRMATRRTDLGKFDHGAQFYSKKDSMLWLHQKWQNEGLVEKWFQSENVDKFISRAGMTALAKSLSAVLSVELGKKALKLNSVAGGVWEIEIENHEAIKADRVVLTAPMPQNLELLDRSGIEVSDRLRQVAYAKAIVLLFEGVSSGEFDGVHGFKENIDESVFSVANQFRKGLHSVPSWTVVMTPKFSDQVFDQDDDQILSLALREITKLVPELTYETVQVKKWRYSHPIKLACLKEEPLFTVVSENLFLAGDSYGGASVAGAVASANQLASFILVGDRARQS